MLTLVVTLLHPIPDGEFADTLRESCVPGCRDLVDAVLAPIVALATPGGPFVLGEYGLIDGADTDAPEVIYRCGEHAARPLREIPLAESMVGDLQADVLDRLHRATVGLDVRVKAAIKEIDDEELAADLWRTINQHLVTLRAVRRELVEAGVGSTSAKRSVPREGD